MSGLLSEGLGSGAAGGSVTSGLGASAAGQSLAGSGLGGFASGFGQGFLGQFGQTGGMAGQLGQLGGGALRGQLSSRVGGLDQILQGMMGPSGPATRMVGGGQPVQSPKGLISIGGKGPGS